MYLGKVFTEHHHFKYQNFFFPFSLFLSCFLLFFLGVLSWGEEGGVVWFVWWGANYFETEMWLLYLCFVIHFYLVFFSFGMEKKKFYANIFVHQKKMCLSAKCSSAVCP